MTTPLHRHRTIFSLKEGILCNIHTNSTYLHSFFSLLLLWDILHLLKMVIYTSYSNEIIAHTHTLESCCKTERRKNGGGEHFHVWFFQSPKRFLRRNIKWLYVVEREGSDMVNWEHIARQLHHSIKRQYRNLEVD